MATMQEIDYAMSGFQYSVKWSDFGPERPPSKSPVPKAYIWSGFKVTREPTFALENGVYQGRGLRVNVYVDYTKSWANDSAKRQRGQQQADLLVHEQGHYNITALIARDYVRNVLDLSIRADIAEVTRGAGSTQKEKTLYAQNSFQISKNKYFDLASSFLDRLQGTYDAQTQEKDKKNGNSTPQAKLAQIKWNDLFKHLKARNENFELWLRTSGMI